MSKDYNLVALQGYGDTDEEITEGLETFPKELLHLPEMNLWLTWYFHLANIESKDSEEKKLLQEQFLKMRLIIRPRYWYEIELPYNDPLSWECDPEWYLDDDKLIRACIECHEKHPHTYPGYIQDEDGFKLTNEFQGRWVINPTDQFWSNEESMEKYYHHYNWRDKTSEELYKNLVYVFGDINLPSWAVKIRDRGKK